jgi:N-acetylmuramoyl-L-alanine amidase
MKLVEKKELSFYAKDRVVLVVEDEDISLKIVNNVLEEYFSKIILTKDGKEALDIFNSGTKIDLVITDVDMPHISGIELARKIKAKTDIPVLILSGNEDIISSVNTVNNSLVLLNSRKIDDIKKSKYKLDNGQVLTIFAIKAKLKPFNKKNFKLKNVDEVKVLRYSPTVTRIVFADKKPIDVSYHISNNKIVFTSKRLSNKSTPVKKQASIMKRKGKIIVIDPGHGGRDSGAIGVSRYQEKKLVYNIAREARRILKQKGYTVYLTRYKDKFLKLKNRTEYANDKNADIFVSIHANSIVKSKQKTTQGVETFFLSPSRSARAKRVALTENQADTKDMNWYSKNLTSTLLVRSNMVASNKLAIDVQSNMLSSLKTKYKNVKDMGVRKGPFWILVGAMMPSILVEVGYITHPVEGKRLQSKQYQNLLSKGIADGIDSYFLKNN